MQGLNHTPGDACLARVAARAGLTAEPHARRCLRGGGAGLCGGGRERVCALAGSAPRTAKTGRRGSSGSNEVVVARRGIALAFVASTCIVPSRAGLDGTTLYHFGGGGTRCRGGRRAFSAMGPGSGQVAPAPGVPEAAQPVGAAQRPGAAPPAGIEQFTGAAWPAETNLRARATDPPRFLASDLRLGGGPGPRLGHRAPAGRGARPGRPPRATRHAGARPPATGLRAMPGRGRPAPGDVRHGLAGDAAERRG